MRGKLGVVVGLGIGYVLGTRAGRARYEQIKEGASKLWHLDPVQERVAEVKKLAASSAMAVPRTLWKGVVKVTQAATGPATPAEKLERAAKAAEQAAKDVENEAKKG